jgi:hypothetical protein
MNINREMEIAWEGGANQVMTSICPGLETRSTDNSSSTPIHVPNPVLEHTPNCGLGNCGVLRLRTVDVIHMWV